MNSDELIDRLRLIADRLSNAPAHTMERAVRAVPDAEFRGAYQAGGLEQVCRNEAAEIGHLIKHLEASS